MITFNGDPKYKARLVKQMKKHRDADKIIQGAYLKDNKEKGRKATMFRGCFIGCALMSDELQRIRKPMIFDDLLERLSYIKVKVNSYSEKAAMRTGIPEGFYRMCEEIFENLDPNNAPDFAVNVLEAIPVGLDKVQLLERIGLTAEDYFNEFSKSKESRYEQAQRLIKLLKG